MDVDSILTDRERNLRANVIELYGYDPDRLDAYLVKESLRKSAFAILRRVRTHPHPELKADPDVKVAEDSCDCGEAQTERYPPEGYGAEPVTESENRIPEGTPADDAALHCGTDGCKTVEADELGLVEGGQHNG